MNLEVVPVWTYLFISVSIFIQFVNYLHSRAFLTFECCKDSVHDRFRWRVNVVHFCRFGEFSCVGWHSSSFVLGWRGSFGDNVGYRWQKRAGLWTEVIFYKDCVGQLLANMLKHYCTVAALQKSSGHNFCLIIFKLMSEKNATFCYLTVSRCSSFQKVVLLVFYVLTIFLLAVEKLVAFTNIQFIWEVDFEKFSSKETS